MINAGDRPRLYRLNGYSNTQTGTQRALILTTGKLRPENRVYRSLSVIVQ